MDRIADWRSMHLAPFVARPLGAGLGALSAVPWALWAIVFVGALVRVVTIDERGLWIDEVTTIWQAQRSVPEIIDLIVTGRLYHPPLFHVSMHYWIEIFGTSEVAIRLLGVLLGIGCIVLAYWAMSAVENTRSALIAAAIVALSPFMIWYSQDARMYSMALFFAFASVGFFARALQRNGRTDWIGYGIFTLCGMMSHYTYIFLPIGQTVFFVAMVVIRAAGLASGQSGGPGSPFRRWAAALSSIGLIRGWLWSVGSMAVVFGTWFMYAVVLPAASSGALNSARIEGARWTFADAVRVTVESAIGFQPEAVASTAVAMWPLALSLVLVSLDFTGYLRSRLDLLVPAAIGLVALHSWGYTNPLMTSSRYYVALLPPCIMLVAGAVAKLPAKRVAFLGAAYLLVVASLLVSQTYSMNNPMRDGAREALAVIAEQHEPSDAVIYYPWFVKSLYEYYQPPGLSVESVPGIDEEGRPRLKAGDAVAQLDLVAGDARRVWLVTSHRQAPDSRAVAPFVASWLEAEDFVWRQQTQFGDTQLILYERVTRQPISRGPK